MLTAIRHKALLVLGCMLLAVMMGACGGRSGPPPATVPPSAENSRTKDVTLLVLELAYWEETHPLIERAVLEGGTPLSEVYLGLYKGLLEGIEDDWEQFVAAVDIALPVYEDTLDKWLKIQAPAAGKSYELHHAYGMAWSARVRTLSMISVGWRTEDIELLQDGLDGMETAAALGRDAEALRAQANTYLLEQCTIHRLPQCS